MMRMSILPERITVKRRRDEEPVDVLYIQHKKLRPSFFWKRVLGEPAKEGQVSPSSNGLQCPSPSQPIIYEPTKDEPSGSIGRDILSSPVERDSFSVGSDDGAAKLFSFGGRPYPSAQRTPKDVSKSETGRIQRRKPRRYHLASPKKQASSLAAPTVDVPSAVLKRPRINLALIVEKYDGNYANDRAQQITDVSLRQVQTAGPEKDSYQPNLSSSRRKLVTSKAEAIRKTASQKEYMQRTEGKSRPRNNGVKMLPNRWDLSESLAAELQNVALEETASPSDKEAHEAGPELTCEANAAQPDDIDGNAQRGQISSGSVALNHQDGINKTDYVHDVFVATLPAQEQTMSLVTSISESPGTDYNNVGVLVIEDDEESFWNALGDSEHSGTDWSSEDENAEDFYGNDYPEDEVNSEDEHSGQAYTFRGQALDDEEFDADVLYWSEDDLHVNRSPTLTSARYSSLATSVHDESDSDA